MILAFSLNVKLHGFLLLILVVVFSIVIKNVKFVRNVAHFIISVAPPVDQLQEEKQEDLEEKQEDLEEEKVRRSERIKNKIFTKLFF